MNHTLIPNTTCYAWMLVILLSLGSFNIARHIHMRWLASYCSLISSNAIVKTIIVIFCLTIIPMEKLFYGDITYQIFTIFLGLLFGYFVVSLEMYITRKMNRQRIINKIFKPSLHENHFLRNAIINKTLNLSSKKNISVKGMVKVRKNINEFSARADDFLNYSLVAVVLVAVAEEFLFRGFMFSIADKFKSNSFSTLLIILSIITFAFSHVAETGYDFLRKLPLSIFTSLGFLTTGSLFAAITTHVFLNVFAYGRVNLQLKQK